jgi:hypothetical protein
VAESSTDEAALRQAIDRANNPARKRKRRENWWMVNNILLWGTFAELERFYRGVLDAVDAAAATPLQELQTFKRQHDLQDCDIVIYNDQLFAGAQYCDALMKDMEVFVRRIHDLNAERLEKLRQQYIGNSVDALPATAVRVPG